MTKPVRVAHVITKLAVGGAQESALVTCEGLDVQRFAQVLFTGVEEDGEGTLFAEAERRGVQVSLAPELVRTIRPLHDLMAARALAERLRSWGAEVVHTHSSKAGIVGRLAALQLGLPAVHSVHGWSFNDEMASSARRAVVLAERWAARHTDALVVEATPDLQKGLDASIGRREQYHLIRNGVDLRGLVRNDEAGRRFRAELGVDRRSTLVGTIGRLADQKAPLAMVDAVARLVADGLDIHFVWVGDGSLRGATEAAVAEAGLSTRFHLVGVRRDVVAALSAFDVFALSSLWEGLPRTITEAMAVGVPVAATAVDGCAEIIVDEEHGLLVPPRQPLALAVAIERLATDPVLAKVCASQGQGRVQGWDQTLMLDKLGALYGTAFGAS